MVIWGWRNSTISNLYIPTQLPETYTVTLTATNSAGSNTVSQANYITASSVTDAPGPLFKSTVNSGYAPLNVQFVDASSNAPSAWIWSFGDGMYFNEPEPDAYVHNCPGPIRSP